MFGRSVKREVVAAGRPGERAGPPRCAQAGAARGLYFGGAPPPHGMGSARDRCTMVKVLCTAPSGGHWHPRPGERSISENPPKNRVYPIRPRGAKGSGHVTSSRPSTRLREYHIRAHIAQAISTARECANHWTPLRTEKESSPCGHKASMERMRVNTLDLSPLGGSTQPPELPGSSEGKHA
eukprot:4503692-Prymnesium_polylepis.1